jgi:Flp pilus assembly protein TadG
MTYVISCRRQFDQNNLMRSHIFSAIRACCVLPAWRSRRGGVAILVAITLVVLIGFVALGTEVVSLLMTSRQMQAAADSAALGAATARTLGYPTAYANEAVALARDSGYVNGSLPNASATVAVNSPPVSGAYSGNAAAVQVVITQARAMLLSGLSHNAAYTLTAKATGLTGEPGACVLALDSSAASAIIGDNNAAITLTNCGIAANSSSSTAIRLQGGADLVASWLNVVGNISLSNGATATMSGATRTSSTTVADPYAARVLPTAAGTCLPGTTLSGAVPPGTYCSMGFSNNATLNGLYIIKDGGFALSNFTVSGTATIVLTGTGTGNNIGSVSVNNNGVLNLTALAPPNATAGMVFFQDIRAPASGTNDFSAAQAITLNGAAYFPHTTLKFDNGTSTGGVCTQLIARLLIFNSGTVNLRGNCTGFGTLPAGGTPGRLVE